MGLARHQMGRVCQPPHVRGEHTQASSGAIEQFWLVDFRPVHVFIHHSLPSFWMLLFMLGYLGSLWARGIAPLPFCHSAFKDKQSLQPSPTLLHRNTSLDGNDEFVRKVVYEHPYAYLFVFGNSFVGSATTSNKSRIWCLDLTDRSNPETLYDKDTRQNDSDMAYVDNSLLLFDGYTEKADASSYTPQINRYKWPYL